MLAQTKRRRFSIYSLPVVVAIGFLLVARLAAWQQSDLIADLADCVAHGETREAIESVRKLAAMPNPPIRILVTAAASDEHETAGAAQVAVSQLLRRWQRDIEAKHRMGTIASQLGELAKTMAEKQNDFAVADHPWLASTAGKILKLANKCPAKKTPLVALHCDAILAAVGADSSATARMAMPVADQPGLATKVQTGNKMVAPKTDLIERKTVDANLEREFSAFTHQADSTGNQGGAHANDDEKTTPNALRSSATSGATESTLNSDGDAAGAKRNELPANDTTIHDEPADDDTSERVSSRPNRLQEPAWLQPLLRIVPAMPIDVQPTDRKASSSALPDSGNDPLAAIGSRELLRRWLATETSDDQVVAPELAKRGFGKLTPRLVQQFFSEDAKERMRMVDRVLAQPGAGTGAWLLLLAEDSDAEVRLFAVTLMATSNDAALVEKAWQATIRDQDPRIADLAGRLRERRAGTLRR